MSIFPDDVQHCISQWLSAYDLMLLYLVGCRAVNSKLERLASNFRISEVQVARNGTYALPIASLHRFSSMRHISIHFRGDPARVDPLFLLSIASTLETLSLSFNNIYTYFTLPEGHELASTLEWENPTDGKMQKNTVLDVGKKFPLLRSLLLNDAQYAHFMTRQSAFSLDCMRNLLRTMPSTLKELEIAPLDRYLGSSLVALLPPSLQSYSLSANSAQSHGVDMRDASDIDLQGLPPSTTKIQLLVHQLHGVLPLHQLPQTLKKLSMRIYLSPLEDETFTGLPAGITDLELELSHSAGDIVGLPASLLHLRLNGLHYPQFGQDIEDHALPDNYQETDANDVLAPSIARQSAMACLPRTLETLIIHHMMIRPSYVACFASLPTTLVRLELSIGVDFSTADDLENQYVSNHDDFGFLASLTNLRTLLISRTSSQSSLVAGDCRDSDMSGLTEPLPSSLTSLNWSWQNATVLNGHFMQCLPSGLQHLRIGKYHVHPTVMEGTGYPTGLESLILDEPIKRDLLQYLPHLPRSLRTLLVVEASPMTRETFPSDLTSLALTFKLSQTLLPSLPSTLQSLKITRDATFMNENVKFLPSGLTSLELSTDNSLSDKCAPLLPRRLTILALPLNAKFTLLGVSQLPRSITSLRLRIISPSPDSFKTVYGSVNALPPDVNLQCITTAVSIRKRAEHELFPDEPTDNLGS